MRKVKLRQILLLILRTLLIICLVMAFARPALRGYLGGFFGTSHANTTLVLLIDNSASMSRHDASGTYFKQATDAALEIANAVEDGDEAVIIPLASLERGKEYPPLHTLADIRNAISHLSLADAPARVEDGLRVASSVLAKSYNINKEIYLISDAQKRNYAKETSLNKSDSAGSRLKLFDERTRLFISDIGEVDKSVGKNLSIDSLKAQTTIFEPGRPLEFEAYIRNTGDGAAENGVISLFYNDERVAQRSVTGLGQNKTEKVSISAQPRGAGILSVRTELEEDALPFDNKRYLSVTLPSTRRIGIFITHEGDAQYIKLALEQTLSENNEIPYSVELHRLEELRMLPSLRSRLDAVMMGIGADEIDAGDMKALKDYIASGKGAAIFALSGMAPQQFNSSVSTALGIPTIESKEGSAGTDKYSSFAQFDFAHPFFSGMFEDKSGSLVARGIESPKVFEYYRFSRGGIPLIMLSSGASFLTEASIGKGKALIYSVPPTFSFSDFPRKAIFLPLIRRTAAYLSSVGAKDENEDAQYYTDEPFDIMLPQLGGEQSGLKLLVKAPDGSSERVESIVTESKSRIRIDNAHAAGIYTIYKDAEAKEPVSSFAVNIRSDEADLRRATKEEADSLVSPLFAKTKESIVRLDPASKDLTKKIKESRFGIELWQTFLVIALLCAIAEMLIAREAKKSEP